VAKDTIEKASSASEIIMHDVIQAGHKLATGMALNSYRVFSHPQKAEQALRDAIALLDNAVDQMEHVKWPTILDYGLQ
jgi:hypothetical protein